jgi:hypothetical protein
MVRFSLAVQPDDPKKATYLLPDKIEHYKYTPIPSGRGFWTLCWRDAVETMIRTGAFLVYFPPRFVLSVDFFRSGAHMRAARRQTVAHALLLQQIASLLRRRISQELEVLRDSLIAVPQGVLDPNAQVIRRLTRSEWADLKASGRLPIPGAAAIIVVPPVHKNMLNPSRPPTSDSKDGDRALSTFCEDASREYITTSSRRKIPIYHGAAVWPNPAERDAVRSLFKEIVGLERKARYKATIFSKSFEKASPTLKSTNGEKSGLVEETDAGPKTRKVARAKGLDKASDAYLLRSTRDTVVRADTAPLCIALWRLRIWFGQGWDRGMWGGWEKSVRTREELMGHLEGKQSSST